MTYASWCPFFAERVGPAPILGAWSVALLCACGGQVEAVPKPTQDAGVELQPDGPVEVGPDARGGIDTGIVPVDSSLVDGGVLSSADAGVVAWIRIENMGSPSFDVCFPTRATDPPDFAGASPMGGSGIATGTTTPFIAVAPETAFMRVVSRGAANCSKRVPGASGEAATDSLGPFEAQAGKYYTVVFNLPYSFSEITVGGP
jgi:hypothetical protein